MIDPTAVIHPKAHVEGAFIGARTAIWQFASVTRGASLGIDCSVAPGAMLDGCSFGDRCRIGPSVSMGPGFLIGHDVFIGPSVTFCNDAWPTADRIGWDIERLQPGGLNPVEWAVVVEDDSSIGANAVILPGVRIGKGSFIAAGAVCHVDVPPGCLFKRDGTIRGLTSRPRRRMRVAR